MEGDSESALIRPSSATEAAPAPGSLGETNALLRELVEAVNGVTAELRRLHPVPAGPAVDHLNAQVESFVTELTKGDPGALSLLAVGLGRTAARLRSDPVTSLFRK